MLNQFTFIAPIFQQTGKIAMDGSWTNVMDAWNEGDTLTMFSAFLSYLGYPDDVKSKNYPIQKYLPHGSILVSIEMDENFFRLKAPFLNIKNALVKPLFRQSLQINHEPLSLSRIVLEQEHLCFLYETSHENAEPGKIYSVLKEICLLADSYDDTFIKRFEAERIVKPQIQHWEEQLKDNAVNHFRNCITEAKDTLLKFEQKRLHTFMWDVLAITLMKADFEISPQGHIRSEIERGLQMLGGNSELSDKIQRGKALLSSFEKMSDQEIKDDLYSIQTLIPYKTQMSGLVLKNKILKIIEQAENELSQGDALAATLTINYHLMQILYYNYINVIYTDSLAQILSSTSSIPFPEAILNLLAALRSFAQGIIDEKYPTADNKLSEKLPSQVKSVFI